MRAERLEPFVLSCTTSRSPFPTCGKGLALGGRDGDNADASMHVGAAGGQAMVKLRKGGP